MRLRFIILLFVILSCVGGGVYVYHTGAYRRCARSICTLFVSKKNDTRNRRSQIENNILDRLKLLEIADSAVRFRGQPTDTAIEIRAAVPRGKPVEWIIWHLSSAAAGTTYHVDDCACSPDERECTIRFLSSVAGEPAVILNVVWTSRYFSKSAKMAIVIRDFGFAADQTTIDYLSFPDPLTVALAPSRKLSSWTAQISNEYKKEIIIMLPMEPLPRHADSSRRLCIMIHYPEERLRSIVTNAMGAVPNFAGFMNNGGARVLEDSRVMTILFDEMKKRHGYFVEEPATRKSVAAEVSRRQELPFLPIDCSIDSVTKVARIQELIKRYALEAQKRGHIIIESKATPEFIRALKNELPVLRRSGIRLSYVSEVVSSANPRGKQ